MDLSHIDGIECRDLKPEGTAKGEAGLGHWRRALNGNIVETMADAETICDAILEEMNIHRGVVVGFRPERKSLRGMYWHGSAQIHLYGMPRLATLLHELAHHVVEERYTGWVQPHGKEFKKTFIEVMRTFGVLNGVDLNKAAMKAYDEMRGHEKSLKPGDLVKCNRGRTWEVTGFGRTRVQIKNVETGRDGYSAKAEYLTPVNEPSKTPQEVAPAAKATPAPTGEFNVGDRVWYGRGQNWWEVTGFTNGGRVHAVAIEAIPGHEKKYPAGRKADFAPKSLQSQR